MTRKNRAEDVGLRQRTAGMTHVGLMGRIEDEAANFPRFGFKAFYAKHLI